MIKFFRKIRQKLLSENKFSKYLIYAFGEIVLVVIGIMIAIWLNESVNESNNNKLRCAYLSELLFTIEQDISGTNSSISAFALWNPKISEIKTALKENRLSDIDSLYNKLGTVGNIIVLGQSSKTKIEELKYSSVNLIENRELKDKVLHYQDDSFYFIRLLDKNYEAIGEDLRKYYAKNFDGFNYTDAIPLDINELENDNYYYSLVSQRLRMNIRFVGVYNDLLIELKEIKELIAKEIKNNCIE